MIRCHTPVFFAVILAAQAHAVPVFVDYDVAATGQSARAGFQFLDASTLQISLSETTPAGASSLTGGSAILTEPRVPVAARADRWRFREPRTRQRDSRIK